MGSRRRRTGFGRRAELHSGQCSRPRGARAVAELSFESAAETGSVCKAKVFGNCRDKLGCRKAGQGRSRFEQPLALNVASEAAGIFEQPIKTGAGHADEPAKGLRSEGGRSQMPADSLSHPLLAPEIDLLPGNRRACCRWCDRRRDHGTKGVLNPREIGLCHLRQAASGVIM